MKIVDKLASSYYFYRILESLPAVISWTMILGPILLAGYKPHLVAYFILGYSVYWVYNSIKFVTYSYLGHKKLLFVMKQNWLEKLQHKFPEEWNKYYYCGLIPYASESYEVICATVQSIADSNFPNNRKILCLSSEKAVPKGKEIAEKLAQEFEGQFAHIFITEHELKPGELKGKSANQNFAARFLYKQITKHGINPEHIMLTSNDADMLNHKEYHAYLLYKFLSDGEKRFKHIYQSIPNDSIDLWDANFFTRVIVGIGLNLQLSLHQRNNYRRTVYSFYSMNLKTLKDMDFWDVDLIPEDERTMFKALFTFGRDFKVVPLFLPANGRPIQGRNKLKAFREQYKQVLRWGWGASEIAHSLTSSLKYKNVPWRLKSIFIFNQMRTHIEWTTSSILPLFGGLMPLILNKDFGKTYLGATLPAVLSVLMQLSAVGLLVIMYVEWKVGPKRPKDRGFLFKAFTFGQWILLPWVGFALTAIPALDAQTRLLFNRRIVYVESNKERLN